MRWRFVVLGALALSIVIFGISLIDASGSDQVSASTILAGRPDISGFSQATAPRAWEFPRDFGPNPEYQTEWWYYTGNLSTADGRRFGFQFTVFRRGIRPGNAINTSEWRTNQLYMAHFAVTDVEGQRFFHEERFSRGSAALAGATSEPTYRVWIEGWEARALNQDATLTEISAATDTFGLRLQMEQIKPPALQGDNGLSQKSEEIGNSSHYYSLTRLVTSGTITVDGATFEVTGYTWKDHEFGTSALGANAVGWDWFGLQLDDQRELMVGQIRLRDGGRDPYFGGLLVNPDGSTEYLPAEAFEIEAAGSWTSPHTGAIYPSGWTIQIRPSGSREFSLTLIPQVLDQELAGGDIAYWEGAVRIDGDVTGYGYAELTGYVDAMTGRF